MGVSLEFVVCDCDNRRMCLGFVVLGRREAPVMEGSKLGAFAHPVLLVRKLGRGACPHGASLGCLELRRPWTYQ